MTTFLLAVATHIAELAFSAGALPLSKALSRGLLWLVTLGVDQQLRSDRFADLEAYLHDEIDDLRQQGYPPVQIAAHVFWHRMVRGIVAELAWWGDHHQVIANRMCLACTVLGSVLWIAWWGLDLKQTLDLAATYEPRTPVVIAINGLCLGWYAASVGMMIRGLVGLHLALWTPSAR